MAIQKNLLADRKVADFRKQGTVYLLVPGAIILSLCTMSPHHSQQCEQQATQGVALISLLSFVKNRNYGTFSLKHSNPKAIELEDQHAHHKPHH